MNKKKQNKAIKYRIYPTAEQASFFVNSFGQMRKLYNLLLGKWQEDKKEDIMGFRNKSYSSTITGTLATVLPKPWLEIMDDSYKSFMEQDFIEAEEDALTGEPVNGQ